MEDYVVDQELTSDSEDEVAEMMSNVGDHDDHHEPFSNDATDTVDSANNGAMSTIHAVLSDTDVLDCSSCSEPLTIPVFQCKNGHIACSRCRDDILCRMCFLPVAFGRCRAIENVLRSIRVPCHNEKYGCKETMSYSDKKNHENKCLFVPCYCPASHCDFMASSKVLSTHVREKHEGSGSLIQFSYDNFFSVTLNCDVDDEEKIALQEQSDGTLFALNKYFWHLGIVVSISCIKPINSSEPGYGYDILAKTQRCEVKLLEASTQNFERRIVAFLSSVFLVIPFDLDSPEPINLDVCIRSRDSARDSHEC